MVQMYKQGDERVFTQYDPEYRLFQELADELTKKSPNKNKYVVDDVYLDFGTSWKWTTISNKDKGYQALSPAEWLALVNETATPAEIADHVLSDKYNPDRLRESKSRSEIVKESLVLDLNNTREMKNSEAFKTLNQLFVSYGYNVFQAYKEAYGINDFYTVELYTPRLRFQPKIELYTDDYGYRAWRVYPENYKKLEGGDFVTFARMNYSIVPLIEELERLNFNELDWYTVEK